MKWNMSMALDDMNAAIFKDVNWKTLDNHDKKALALARSVAQVICKNAKETVIKDPKLLNDPLWQYVNLRIKAFPFSLQAAESLISAYESNRSRYVMDTLIRGGDTLSYLEKVYGTLSDALTSVKESPVYAVAASGDTDKLIGCFFSQSMPEMVQTAIKEDKTGRLAEWFGDLL